MRGKIERIRKQLHDRFTAEFAGRQADVCTTSRLTAESGGRSSQLGEELAPPGEHPFLVEGVELHLPDSQAFHAIAQRLKVMPRSLPQRCG